MRLENILSLALMERQSGVTFRPNKMYKMYVKTHYRQVGGHMGAGRENGHT